MIQKKPKFAMRELIHFNSEHKQTSEIAPHETATAALLLRNNEQSYKKNLNCTMGHAANSVVTHAVGVLRHTDTLCADVGRRCGPTLVGSRTWHTSEHRQHTLFPLYIA